MAIALDEKHREARHLPGEIGIWMMVLLDITAFTLLFVVFMYYKGAEPDVFREAHQHMNQAFGAINTFLLLSSSWFVASGVQLARRGDRFLAARLFTWALYCGVGFGLIKYFEYSEKLHAGLTIQTNWFFHCYYMFTSIHLFHVTLGSVMLFLMARALRSEGAADKRRMRFIEAGATFWHMVDLLWIVLFALFYLMR